MNFKIISLVLMVSTLLYTQLFTPDNCAADDTFNSTGYIEQIDRNKIIIDDSSLYLNASTSFYNEQGTRVSKSAVKPGYQVDYEATNGGELLSLTIISSKKDKRRNNIIKQQNQQKKDSAQKPASGSSPGITLDNGVWKN